MYRLTLIHLQYRIVTIGVKFKSSELSEKWIVFAFFCTKQNISVPTNFVSTQITQFVSTQVRLSERNFQ